MSRVRASMKKAALSYFTARVIIKDAEAVGCSLSSLHDGKLSLCPLPQKWNRPRSFSLLLLLLILSTAIYRMELEFVSIVMEIYDNLEPLPAFQAVYWRAQGDSPENFGFKVFSFFLSFNSLASRAPVT